MSAQLHQEYVATVDREMPWGLMVVLVDGTEVLVDRTKVGEVASELGSSVVVVILDDERSPARASMLDADRIVARRLREGGTT